jgi:hypothetical protein
MLTINKANNTDNIVLTLTEKVTLTNPYFLFVFTHITTKAQVKFVAGSDLSNYPWRYNEFTITNSLFSIVGQYIYQVYEQSSPTNTDPTGLNLLETGRAQFKNTPFTITKYAPTTNYTTYAG